MREMRFWRWFRTLPLMAMGVLCVLTALVIVAPDALVRQMLFPVKYADLIESASERYGVDEYLICAVIKCESDWDSKATSSAGAVGLMQLIPSTSQEVARLGLVSASAYDPDNLTDPATNIEYGTAYLAYLQSNLSSRDQVVAAYNAGLGAVSGWLSQGEDISNQIRYAETATYLVRVNEAYERYAQFYPNGIAAA